MNKNKTFKISWILIVICLMLGLAPFQPEPHIIGKIRWIAGGAKGMSLQDWMDTFMHGIPLIAFLVLFILKWRSGA